MGYKKYLTELWNDHDKARALIRNRLIEWRKGNSVVRVDNPTRPDKAHRLGYRAKQGYVVARVRVLRGGHMRPRISSGRKSKNTRRKLVLGMNYRLIAEQRANKHYPNCEVINSYFLAKDGRYYFFEVLMIDRELGKKYPKISNLARQRGRVYRGLTSTARKARGLYGKGKGYEKERPSKHANKMRRKN